MSKCDPKKDNQNNDNSGSEKEEDNKLQYHPGANPENQSEMIMMMGD
ncbi:hypothetical protein IK146_03350 [Candidatus Saccharibacteria bacterium]|nr:hypothetical protein [Candidatus Saccharibacteria bacterium]